MIKGVKLADWCLLGHLFFYWGSVVNHVHLRHARNASPFQLLQKGSWNKTEQEKSQFPGRRQSTEIHEWRMTCLTWFTFTDNAHCVCYFLWSYFFFLRHWRLHVYILFIHYLMSYIWWSIVYNIICLIQRCTADAIQITT